MMSVIWTCDKSNPNSKIILPLSISYLNAIGNCVHRLYGQDFFKVYDVVFVSIFFWLFEWKVCLMYNIGLPYSHFPKLYLSTFHAVARPKIFDKAASCHLYDHIVSEFLLVCNIYEWQEMKCYRSNIWVENHSS